MKSKVVIGKKVLIPVQDVHPEVADMMLGLIQARHPSARRVLVP